MTQPRMIDGVARNKKVPATFEIPTLQERDGLRVGDFAKIGWEGEFNEAGVYASGERVWYIITEVMAPGLYKGKLNNDPVVYLDMPKEIEFEAKHVLDFIKDGGDEGDHKEREDFISRN